eukprot:TRINITY_DN63889_c0_g1_i1.p1 TRINITY_DN63889_c0_g1~~TRINITY_DN63889_c0_g1_i1.p1  ORF type:complete len:457 (-),score=79.69 TRINITY_DN63889_c0_g1_i1:70-1440(-)
MAVTCGHGVAVAATMDEAEPGDLDDDLPPLVGPDGEEMPAYEEVTPASASATGEHAAPRGEASAARSGADPGAGDSAAEAYECEALRTAAALRAAAVAQEAIAVTARERSAGADAAAEAVRRAMGEAEDRKPEPSERPPCEATQRMVEAIARDDFEEVEASILRGADVHVDCGGGMQPLHASAMRGDLLVTELLIAHGANINVRDLSGNTPLLYACHFYKQHGRGVQLTAQLLFHRADPHYRVKEGKLAGMSALDLATKACREPNMDENVPRQMCAMIKLTMEGNDECQEAVAKIWASVKSENKKLFQVSSKQDSYGYKLKTVEWVLPAGVQDSSGIAPKKIADSEGFISEERFINLTDYSLSDEGATVKVYITFPDAAATSLKEADRLQVHFLMDSFDLQLRGSEESYRLRIEPLFGTIDVEKCKYRVSVASKRVSLTLAKRHVNRQWPCLQKGR